MTNFLLNTISNGDSWIYSIFSSHIFFRLYGCILQVLFDNACSSFIENKEHYKPLDHDNDSGKIHSRFVHWLHFSIHLFLLNIYFKWNFAYIDISLSLYTSNQKKWQSTEKNVWHKNKLYETRLVVYFSPVDFDDVFFDDELVSFCDVGKLPPSAFFGNNIYKKKVIKIRSWIDSAIIFYLLNVG